MKRLSRGTIEACRSLAQDELKEFSPRSVIDDYAPLPPFAMQRARDFLADLPAHSNTMIDAFMALEILKITREQLIELLREDAYLDKQARDQTNSNWTRSLLPEEKGPRKLDDEINQSARGDGHTDAADRKIRQDAENMDKAVHESFEAELRRDVTPPVGEDEVAAVLDEDLDGATVEPGPPNVNKMDPVQCYSSTVRYLAAMIVFKCLGKNGERIQPLLEGHVVTPRDIRSLCLDIERVAGQLRYRGADGPGGR